MPVQKAGLKIQETGSSIRCLTWLLLFRIQKTGWLFVCWIGVFLFASCRYV